MHRTLQSQEIKKGAWVETDRKRKKVEKEKGPEVAKLEQLGEHRFVDTAAVSAQHLLLPCAPQVVAEI
jgi:hypothetical protein